MHALIIDILTMLLRKAPTPEDNYIYACSAAVLYVRKHVLQIICSDPFTPTAGVLVGKEREKKFIFKKGNGTR